MFEHNWLEVIRSIGPTLIALVGVAIAWNQWRINRANLREKLFERRLAVYDDVQSALSSVLQNAAMDDTNFAKLIVARNKAAFLFGKEVQDRLDELQKKIIAHRRTKRRLQDAKQEEQLKELFEAEDESLAWLLERSSDIVALFKPYLAFPEA